MPTVAARAANAAEEPPRVVVLISADAEWRAVRALLPDARVEPSPFGEWFVREVDGKAGRRPVVYFHGGWGKVAAAGSTQYAIDRFRPERIVNLGTCGGFAGATAKGDVVLADKTVIYDIVELMGDSTEAIADYTTELDVPRVGADFPKDVRRGPLASADRDLSPADLDASRRATAPSPATGSLGPSPGSPGGTGCPFSFCAESPTWWARAAARPTATSRPSRRALAW